MRNKIKLCSIGTALLISILLTGCEEHVSSPKNSASTTTNIITENKPNITTTEVGETEDNSISSESVGDQDSNTEQSSSTDTSTSNEEKPELGETGINDDVLWAMGKSFDELTKKYGDVTTGNFNTYSFKNGYGVYVWDPNIEFADNDRDKNISLIKACGGCKKIDSIQAKDFIKGDFSALNYEDFASKCGVEYTILPEDNTGIDDYWHAYFSHPLYENMVFIMSTAEKNVIDETTLFTVQFKDF